jgi:replicative DNA helicase
MMFNKQNEVIILDCCIMSNVLLPTIIDNVKDVDFYIPQHQTIFNLIKTLNEQNIKISVSSLHKAATERNITIKFTDILGNWTGTDIKPFVESLKDDSNRRQIKLLLQQQNELIVDRGNPIDAIYNEIDNKLREITANQISPITFLSEMKTGDIYDLASNRQSRKTGFAELDRALWGIGAGELIILAGQTSHGKSAVTGNIGTFIADHYNSDHVLWFSLEMPKEQIRRRFVGQYAQYDNFKIKIKKYDTAEEKEKVRLAMEKVDGLPIGIVDREFDISKIVGIARRFSHRHKISVIVVDYLQQVSNYMPGVSTAYQIGNTVKQLKDLAMELQVPLICLSQFSRKAEKDEFPDLSWLKETSTIEQAADMVWFLHRYSDKQKERLEDEYLRHVENLYRFIVAKNRDGKANFHVEMEFTPETTTFKCI